MKYNIRVEKCGDALCSFPMHCGNINEIAAKLEISALLVGIARNVGDWRDDIWLDQPTLNNRKMLGTPKSGRTWKTQFAPSHTRVSISTLHSPFELRKSKALQYKLVKSTENDMKLEKKTMVEVERRLWYRIIFHQELWKQRKLRQEKKLVDELKAEVVQTVSIRSTI